MVPVCPRCHVALFLLRYEGVEVDHCPACGGFWLDAGEIEDLARATRGASVAARLRQVLSGGGTPGARFCPRCDGRLIEFDADLGAGGEGTALRLDRCPKGHGLWFDARELPRLLAALPAGDDAEAMARSLPAIFGAARSAP